MDAVVTFDLELFVAGLSDPAILFGHFTYFLLILSMMMRRITWLRTLAIASGLTKIFYRAVLVPDPVSVFWETIFVLVNVGQLLLIWYYQRYHKFAEHEELFLQSMPANIERRSMRRLLNIATTRSLDVGATLTQEGEKVKELMYIASGVVTIERGGAVVAACGAGDYVGEMSFLTGKTATARVARPVELLVFDQQQLHAAADSDAGIRRIVETSLNQNLVGKLVRTSS